MYLAVFNHAGSAVLLKVRDGPLWPVYHISKTLVDAKTRYLPLEKLALAHSPCNKKVAPLFSCPHSLCTNRIILVVIVKEIKFHGTNSQMGDHAWIF